MLNSSKPSKTAAAGSGFGVGGSVGYEAVAASATAQVLGATGASGDRLDKIIIQPATTSPGAVTVLDNAITVLAYPGGSAATVEPFEVVFGLSSVSGAWKITTGADVSVLAIGSFT